MWVCLFCPLDLDLLLSSLPVDCLSVHSSVCLFLLTTTCCLVKCLSIHSVLLLLSLLSLLSPHSRRSLHLPPLFGSVYLWVGLPLQFCQQTMLDYLSINELLMLAICSLLNSKSFSNNIMVKYSAYFTLFRV